MGCWGEWNGTVLVSAGIQEVLWERWGNRGKLAGESVRFVRAGGKGLGNGQIWSLRFNYKGFGEIAV
nr:hypothetical protein [Tanacetum cinerariifolium]